MPRNGSGAIFGCDSTGVYPYHGGTDDNAYDPCTDRDCHQKASDHAYSGSEHASYLREPLLPLLAILNYCIAVLDSVFSLKASLFDCADTMFSCLSLSALGLRQHESVVRQFQYTAHPACFEPAVYLLPIGSFLSYSYRLRLSGLKNVLAWALAPLSPQKTRNHFSKYRKQLFLSLRSGGNEKRQGFRIEQSYLPKFGIAGALFSLSSSGTALNLSQLYPVTTGV